MKKVVMKFNEGDVVGNNITFIREIDSIYTVTKKGQKRNERYAIFRCFCGKEFKQKVYLITTRGKCQRKSCGCLKDAIFKKNTGE